MNDPLHVNLLGVFATFVHDETFCENSQRLLALMDVGKKFSDKGFFSKHEQIRSSPRIYSHLLKMPFHEKLLYRSCFQLHFKNLFNFPNSLFTTTPSALFEQRHVLYEINKKITSPFLFISS